MAQQYVETKPYPEMQAEQEPAVVDVQVEQPVKQALN